MGFRDSNPGDEAFFKLALVIEAASFYNTRFPCLDLSFHASRTVFFP